jgi:hypothetical protein
MNGNRELKGRSGQNDGEALPAWRQAARSFADLTVYLRQHHAERDLARLGELVAESSTEW